MPTGGSDAQTGCLTAPSAKFLPAGESDTDEVSPCAKRTHRESARDVRGHVAGRGYTDFDVEKWNVKFTLVRLWPRRSFTCADIECLVDKFTLGCLLPRRSWMDIFSSSGEHCTGDEIKFGVFFYVEVLTIECNFVCLSLPCEHSGADDVMDMLLPVLTVISRSRREYAERGCSLACHALDTWAESAFVGVNTMRDELVFFRLRLRC